MVENFLAYSVYVYVIGWQAVVFEINSSRIVNRKEIVLCYKLIRQA